MEVLVKRIVHKSRTDTYHLFPLGDIHCGTTYCAESAIKAKVSQIQHDPLALWIGMGDYGDCITPRDIRWDSAGIADWLLQERQNIMPAQENWLVDLFEPIKDKCLGLIEGNHETAMRIHGHHDLAMNLCKRLGVSYLGYTAFVRLVFGQGESMARSFTVQCLFAHGSGGPQTDGGRIMNLVKSLRYFDCDILAKGHLHAIETHEESILRLTEAIPPMAVEMNRCAAITGSWCYTYKQGVRPSYAEIKQYAPTRIGCPVFAIKPDKKEINVFSNSKAI